MSVIVAVLIALCVQQASADRVFRITNTRKETIWIGTWGYVNNCADVYKPAGGGFAIDAGKKATISVPNDWCSGRIWARTGCSSASGVFKCETGDCGNGVQCSTTGQAPATLAEFTFPHDPTVTVDTYDMSLVDGYNVGMRIKPFGGKKVPGLAAKYNCGTAACGFKVATKCPKELKTTSGHACMSICQAVTQKNTQDTQYIANFDQALVCCSCDCGPNCGCDNGTNPACRYGCSPAHPTQPPYNYSWSGVCDANTWPKASTGQSYPEIYKSACPDAYSWQFDDAASTYQCISPTGYEITIH